MSYRPECDSRVRRRLLGAFSAGAVGLSWPSILRADADPIRVGFPVPLTGPFGAEAQDQVRGAQLAIKEFNEAGGLKGRQAELLVRDDKLNPTEAATRTLELLEKDKAHFIVGSLSAAVQLSINNVTRQRGIIFNSVSQSDAINEAKDWSKYTFHEAPNPHMTAAAVGRYVFSKLGKRVVFLTADYAFGNECVRGFERAGKPMGVEFLGDIRHPIGHADFSTFLPKIQSLKPDVLVVVNFGRDQINALKQINDFGLKKSMRVAAPLLLYTGRLAAGPQVYADVVGGTSWYWSLEDSVPSAKRLNDRFKAEYKGAVPSDYGATAYAGVRSVLAAAAAAGTTDSEAVVEAMRALKYDWYKGPQHFRRCDHQAVQSFYVIESKAPRDMKGDHDVYKIIAEEKFEESRLRSCEELGHKA